MKTIVKLCIFSGALLLSLTACGLQGSLERPPPLVGAPIVERTFEAPPELKLDVDVNDLPDENELGGEVPKAAPVETVGEEGLGAIGSE